MNDLRGLLWINKVFLWVQLVTSKSIVRTRRNFGNFISFNQMAATSAFVVNFILFFIILKHWKCLSFSLRFSAMLGNGNGSPDWSGKVVTFFSWKWYDVVSFFSKDWDFWVPSAKIAIYPRFRENQVAWNLE